MCFVDRNWALSSTRTVIDYCLRAQRGESVTDFGSEADSNASTDEYSVRDWATSAGSTSEASDLGSGEGSCKGSGDGVQKSARDGSLEGSGVGSLGGEEEEEDRGSCQSLYLCDKDDGPDNPSERLSSSRQGSLLGSPHCLSPRPLSLGDSPRGEIRAERGGGLDVAFCGGPGGLCTSEGRAAPYLKTRLSPSNSATNDGSRLLASRATSRGTLSVASSEDAEMSSKPKRGVRIVTLGKLGDILPDAAPRALDRVGGGGGNSGRDNGNDLTCLMGSAGSGGSGPLRRVPFAIMRFLRDSEPGDQEWCLPEISFDEGRLPEAEPGARISSPGSACSTASDYGMPSLSRARSLAGPVARGSRQGSPAGSGSSEQLLIVARPLGPAELGFLPRASGNPSGPGSSVTSSPAGRCWRGSEPPSRSALPRSPTAVLLGPATGAIQPPRLHSSDPGNTSRPALGLSSTGSTPPAAASVAPAALAAYDHPHLASTGLSTETTEITGSGPQQPVVPALGTLCAAHILPPVENRGRLASVIFTPPVLQTAVRERDSCEAQTAAVGGSAHTTQQESCLLRQSSIALESWTLEPGFLSGPPRDRQLTPPEPGKRTSETRFFLQF